MRCDRPDEMPEAASSDQATMEPSGLTHALTGARTRAPAAGVHMDAIRSGASSRRASKSLPLLTRTTAFRRVPRSNIDERLIRIALANHGDGSLVGQLGGEARTHDAVCERGQDVPIALNLQRRLSNGTLAPKRLRNSSHERPVPSLSLVARPIR